RASAIPRNSRLSRRCASPLVSARARSCGIPITIEAHTEAPRPGVEPRTPRSKRGMISLSPSGRKWTCRDLNPDFQPAELVSSPWTIGPLSMDRRRFELRFPPCEGGVLPLDEQPNPVRETRAVRGGSRHPSFPPGVDTPGMKPLEAGVNTVQNQKTPIRAEKKRFFS